MQYITQYFPYTELKKVLVIGVKLILSQSEKNQELKISLGAKNKNRF